MASAKPSLASVAASMGGADVDEEADAEMDAEYSTAIAELADVLGISEEKVGAFGEALEAVIRSCK